MSVEDRALAVDRQICEWIIGHLVQNILAGHRFLCNLAFTRVKSHFRLQMSRLWNYLYEVASFGEGED